MAKMKLNPDHVWNLVSFLKGESKKDKVEFEMVCPAYMIELAKEAGIIVNTDDCDTNGWQQDYWMKGTYKGKSVDVAGGMWYGEGSIYWSDEEPTDEDYT